MTCGGIGAAMESPDGTPGSGWDVRLETPEREALNLPPSPTDSGPGPRKQTSEAHPTGRGKLEGGDGARAGGEASGSGSGSPDENVNKRSNPPSPRDPGPTSPEAASARERDSAGLPAPSSPLPHQIPAAFEQRRRDALAAKQRRLDGIIGRVSSGSSSAHHEDARAERAAASDTAAAAAATRSHQLGALRASPPRVRASPARSKKTDSDVDEDWDDLLADATPLFSPPSGALENAKTPGDSSAPWRAFEPTPEPPTSAASFPRLEIESETDATKTSDASNTNPPRVWREGWLSDAAAAAERAAERAGGGPMPPPASPPRAERVAEIARFAEDDTMHSAEASGFASSPGTRTPRKPPTFSFPSTPQGNRDDERRASPAMDKVAAARRIMAAASPAKQKWLSPRAAKEPVTNLVFSPPPGPSRVSLSATSTPRPSQTRSPLAGAQRSADALTGASPSSSASATPDARKRAAARRIMLAAAARKASAGVPFDAASPSRATHASAPGTPKPAPFESPISPIPPADASPADASPAEPAAGTVPPRNPEQKKPLAARGLGSALEANADSSNHRGMVPPRAASPGLHAERVGDSAGRTEPAIEGPAGPPDAVRVAAPRTAARAEESEPKEKETASARREAGEVETRAPETETETEPSIATPEPADAFAFDAPKRDESRRSDAPDDDSRSADRFDADADAGYGTALETQSGFSASLDVLTASRRTDDERGDDTAHDTRGGGKTRGLGGLDSRRATRVALERAEMLAMKLEENEFLREALETRVAEAERAAEEALGRKQANTGDQLDRLKAEVDRNAYLRRLLKKAEQRRGEARAREREAAAKFEALQSSAHRDAATFALRLDRYEEESRGMRRRVSAEKARNQALERAVSRANVELAEQHRRGKSASQLLGMAVAAVVVLILRVLAGGRGDPPMTAGGYPGGREAYVADTAARANPARAAGFGPAA